MVAPRGCRAAVFAREGLAKGGGEGWRGIGRGNGEHL